MLKNKYQRMSNEQKKATKIAYFSTDNGKINKSRLFRVLIIGFFCIIYSVYFNSKSLLLYLYSIFVFVAGVIFIIGYLWIKGKLLNKFAINQED